MKAFTSTHALEFEACDWPHNPSIKLFRIGTCEGQWGCTSTFYFILSVINNKPGNGHLQDVFDWFENSCKRDNKSLMILDFFNPAFKRHCIEKRGFTDIKGTDDVIKHFNAKTK